MSKRALFQVTSGQINVQAAMLLFICLCLYIPITSIAQRGGEDEEGATQRRASIIDDSTRMIYGPHTVLRFNEDEIFYNRLNKEPLDSNIWSFHRYLYMQRFENKYQDLGNNGTAMYSIFPQAPNQVGANDGYYVYDLYFNRQPFEYIDTKSPYSYMDIVLGGNNRAMTEAGYSRNINPQWNAGFNFRGIFTDRQIQRVGRGDRQVTSNYYDFNTSHISKNNKYKLLANHRRMNARVRETGGVRVTSPDPDENIDLFFADNVQPWISNTNTWELRTHTHIYQEYSLKEFFQVYHRLDREKRQNRFKGPGGIAAIEYYNFLNPALDSLEASDRTKFVTFQNEAGIKGSIWRLFYNGFVKLRSVDFTYNHLRSDTLGINAQRLEFYLGGRGGLQFDKEQYLEAEFEVMQDGNYRVSSVFTTKLLEARAQRSLSKPGFIFLAYRGAHNEWFNNFNDTDYSSLDVRLNLNLPRIKLSPAVNYVDIGNYIFMRETPVGSEQKFLATQSSGRQRILMPSLKFQFEPLKKVFLSGEVIYSNILENADKAIQLPEFFSNVQLAYRHDVEGKGIGYHFGIDVHWRSSYYALSYGTAMQQFYVQESFKVPDFPLVDPFVNLKIKRARIFVRYHNALAALSNSGIMLTPWHPGMPNIADFGVNWMFFD